MLEPDSIDSKIKAVGNNNQHPIGIFLYRFNSLDTNAYQDHLIDTLPNGQFVDVANRPRSPYFTHTSFLASPLFAEGQVLEAGGHEFYIDPLFFLSNENITIQSITVEFNDGSAPWVVNNPYGSAQSRAGIASLFKNLGGGTIIGRIIVVGLDVLGQTVFFGNPFKLFIKNTKTYQPLTFCKGGGQQWIIEAPQSRLDPINAQYGNPQLDYEGRKDIAYFYFAGNGSSCNTNVLKRPVVFIDGFDPTNSRDVKKIYEDYINVQVTRNGDPETKFGDYMLNEGYDFVILDFKHGNDLLERNAMTLISLIERLNQTYGSTMEQGITLIGPSMGSLIAQYALAWMEKNNIAHNVKVYISFDGCHQGANVPIGLQNFVEYFTKRGVLKNVKIIRQGLYNGLAARQMLAHHVSANSHFPAPDALRTTFLQNLASVNEYPQLCRKVALINGTNTGQINPFHPNPSETLLRIYTQRKGWRSLWGECRDKICMKLDWNCYTTPNSGKAKVMDNWTVEPLFNLLFWVPLGRTNKYADAAWGNSSQDNAPGGTFGTFFGTNPGDINESNFVFLLKKAMYLLTSSKRTGFTQNINEFTMMPSYSAADLRFPNKNLYMKWDDQYLCGKTPFDFVYAPPVNERHVFVSAKGSTHFENEVRCNNNDLPKFYTPYITGSNLLCNTETYSIQVCNSNPTITWTSSPFGVVSLTPNNNTVTVTPNGNGVITLTATITWCGQNWSVSKTIVVGGGNPPTITHVNFDRRCGSFAEAYSNNPLGATGYVWNLNFGQVIQDNDYPAGNYFYTAPLVSSPRRNLTYYNYLSVQARTSCGLSDPSPLKLLTVGPVPSTCDGGGPMLLVAPNPGKSKTIATIKDGETGLEKDIVQIKVLDKMGNIVKQINYPTGTKKAQIDLSTLLSDVYVVMATSDGKEWLSTQLKVE